MKYKKIRQTLTCQKGSKSIKKERKQKKAQKQIKMQRPIYSHTQDSTKGVN